MSFDWPSSLVFSIGLFLIFVVPHFSDLSFSKKKKNGRIRPAMIDNVMNSKISYLSELGASNSGL